VHATLQMDDPEFSRAISEGMAALERSRERLRKDRDKPTDWKRITPEALMPAVEHIREDFERVAWQLSEQIECGCFLSLHPDLAVLPKHKGRQNLIPVDGRNTWYLQFEGMNDAERFAHWVQQYTKFLKHNVAIPFNSLLKIGLAQETRLRVPPVEWAKTLTRALLYSLRWTVPHLIKRMCDAQDEIPDPTSENFDAHCAWVYWRAPAFVYMEPLGNTPYDETRAWQRGDDAEITELLLRGLASKMLDPSWFKLDRMAGEASVSLASISPAPSSDSEDGSSVSPRVTPVANNGVNDPPRAPGKQNELPEKKEDFSRYMDGANLTDRQRDCFSLKFEYGLTFTAVAERLGIHRTTVEEHIAAAKRRIQISTANDRLGTKGRHRDE
jgi:DNA-binding CsgD family transcriptional regulator